MHTQDRRRQPNLSSFSALTFEDLHFALELLDGLVHRLDKVSDTLDLSYELEGLDEVTSVVVALRRARTLWYRAKEEKADLPCDCECGDERTVGA